MDETERTRLAIDAATALRIIREDPPIADRHPLVGPAALRSHVMSSIYREVRAGRIDEKSARAELDLLAGLKVRMLGDRVSRQTAWKIAMRLGWDDTARAEYLAVAHLQADALVTDDSELAAAARGIVPVAGFDELRG